MNQQQRNRSKWLVAGLALVLALLAVTVWSSALSKFAAGLGVTSAPRPYTELYLNQVALLTPTFVPDKKFTVTATLSSHELNDEKYSYKVTFANADLKLSETLARGTIEVAKSAKKKLVFRVTPTLNLDRAKISIIVLRIENPQQPGSSSSKRLVVGYWLNRR